MHTRAKTGGQHENNASGPIYWIGGDIKVTVTKLKIRIYCSTAKQNMNLLLWNDAAHQKSLDTEDRALEETRSNVHQSTESNSATSIQRPVTEMQNQLQFHLTGTIFCK